jgi:hypothetical protein
MARTFKELKLEAPEQLEKLRERIRFNLGSHKRTRLSRARCGEPKTLLHDGVAKLHANMLRDDYKKRFGKLNRDAAHERLRFLTVLHSVARLDKRDVRRAIKKMEAALQQVFRDSGAWALGAVEVEIVNIALLRRIDALDDDEARKLNVLERLYVTGSAVGAQQHHGVLVHFHAIVDLVGNSSVREEQLRERAKKIAAWQRSPYQVEIKRLFKDRTVIQNIQGIASYVTKGGNEQLRYNAGFGRELDDDLDAKMWRAGTGRADKGGEIVADERGLTIGEIAFLDDVWRDLMDRKRNKRGYLVRLG